MAGAWLGTAREALEGVFASGRLSYLTVPVTTSRSLPIGRKGKRSSEHRASAIAEKHPHNNAPVAATLSWRESPAGGCAMDGRRRG